MATELMPDLSLRRAPADRLVSIEKRDHVAGLGDDGSESLFDESVGAGADDAGHRAGNRTAAPAEAPSVVNSPHRP